MLLTQNSKMRKTSQIMGIKTMNFSLPALSTCPFAGECRKWCYASKGKFIWPIVRAKHQFNLQATTSDGFEVDMIEEIIMREVGAVRIHDSGDFYTFKYFIRWVKITKALPHVTFYAYTKSIPLVQGIPLPYNFTLIYSYGGKADHLIDTENDRHAKVFTDYIPTDYAYANDNDHIALAKNNKIGLLKH